jgi:HAD superfamily hydrolase (TIGR01490 family)
MSDARIALFDLDHTLIPFDSGTLFIRFLAERGALPPDFQDTYVAHCRRYAEGRLDIVEMHRFTVGALAHHPPPALQHWLVEFEATLAPRVPEAARALVQHHRAAGHLCALVTATTRFIAEPFARLLGLDHLLATEPQRDAHGRYTGGIAGQACFGPHKVAHVRAWLAHGNVSWERVARSWFYSDSINDLPLLLAVTDPVAIDPDPRLRAEADARGWPVRGLADSVPIAHAG